MHFTVTTRPPGWDGWREGTAPVPAPLLTRAGDGAWSAGGRSAFTYRDLGLARASAGAIGARHVRRVGAGEAGFDWHCHDADFQFNYVIGGSATVETEHGERYRLSPGDAICEPGLHRVRELDFSADYECIQIAVPAEAAPPIVGVDTELPPRARVLDPARRTAFSAAESRAARDAAAGRAWRRDLGAGAVSSGRILIALAAAGAGGAYASAACWMVVLEGALTLAPGGGGAPVSSLGPFDAAGCAPRSGAVQVTAGAGGVLAIELELRQPATGRSGDGVR